MQLFRYVHSFPPERLAAQKLGLGAADADIGEHAVVECRQFSAVPRPPSPLAQPRKDRLPCIPAPPCRGTTVAGYRKGFERDYCHVNTPKPLWLRTALAANLTGY
jgi:hypothetical protein